MQRQTTHTRKRTHLKPSQVAVLQESFVTNALPDAAKRSHLARALEVSERTVQIWFQNRRAKARKSEAYSLGQEMTSLVPNVRTGWIEPPKLNKPTRTPSSFVQRFRSVSSRPDIKKHTQNDNMLPNCVLTTRALSEGTDRHQETTIPSHLSIPVNTLRIGTWARFISIATNNECDLICYCYTLEKKMVWQVQEGGAKFRIEMDFDQISQIRLGQVSKLPSLSTSTSTTSTSTSSSSLSTTPPASTPRTAAVGQLQIHVTHPHQVQFSMCQANKEDWVQCADFSEHTQVSVEQVHILQGMYDALRLTFIEISTRLPELAHKMVFLNPATSSTETSLFHHPAKQLMTSEAPYMNTRTWPIDTKLPPSVSTPSFDEYMQLLQQQQTYSPSMFI